MAPSVIDLALLCEVIARLRPELDERERRAMAASLVRHILDHARRRRKPPERAMEAGMGSDYYLP